MPQVQGWTARWAKLGISTSALLGGMFAGGTPLEAAAPCATCRPNPYTAPYQTAPLGPDGRAPNAMPWESPNSPNALTPDQSLTEPELPPEQFAALGGQNVALSDISAAYIDFARPTDIVRFRFDAAYDNIRPNRAEFIYARGAPAGPGLALPETNADFQEYFLYLERRLTEDVSLFADMGMHAINPEVNSNSSGIADLQLGFKYAFVNNDCEAWSFQLRTFVPTGDEGRGLGTGHVSLEPGLLYTGRLAANLNLFAEAKYWIPIDGTPGFAGDVARYGLGVRYLLTDDGCGRYIAPTFEVVGWTVINGAQSFPDGGAGGVEDAKGITIVNIKPGVRIGLTPRSDMYIGYGHAVTDDAWYRDLVRAEFRFTY